MKPPPQPSNESTSPEWDQLCMLYLLGELDAEQAATLQRRLESSPELGRVLLRQADVIATLSVTPPEPTRATVSTSEVSHWQVVASIVAIAACVAIIVLGARPDTPNPVSVAQLSDSAHANSEDLLIARAWANSHLNEVTDDFGINEPEIDVTIAVADDPSDVDSTLSWMFIAVSASIESNASGAATDG